MSNDCFEIERKYLIRFPDLASLSAKASKTEIIQTYLICPESGCSDRVRKRGAEGKWIYTHTVKKHISDLRRVENEREITEQEYAELLKNADPGRRVIFKSRYCLNCGDLIFEIDIYPFWSDRAVMEVELENEQQEICLPPDIELIREITHDRRYTNASLAKAIPNDDI